ncbi:MAG: cytochrome-c oxidase, cbb3-type subunit III [Halopseudomonas yangmingensis]|uniref:Cbb3-type cytochrome c oxidase subunit n=1 Tax=Halopseudomonas yangmingensis TaxID=1720063 RepID=A0A1I4UIX4_9GAMM|nr:cytochrome-c oxidase, cbb3-type subunit III [Halopseudomonas yangmingensis]SFM88841.1 cytochrome c oxidase cbb3-type subunit 3 [Halopseudomonas yangmingensis]
MSNFWSGYIIVLTLITLGLILWLLLATRKGQRPGHTDETMGHAFDGIEEYDNPLPRWWFMLFIGTMIFAGIYLALYPGLGKWQGVLGWTQVGQYEREVERAEAQFAPIFARYSAMSVEEVAKDPEALRIGQRLFATNCSVCHGSDARGAFGFPNLTDNDWIWGGSTEQILATLRQGRQAVMPSHAHLGEEAIRNTAGYVRHLSGLETDGVDLDAGKQVFQTVCMACHGMEGKGNPMLGAPNLTNDTWLYGSSMVQIQHTLRNGRNGNMPAQAHLGDDKLHILTAYVYSLSQDADGQ